MAYFVDTSYFLALLHARDANHRNAVRWQQQEDGRFVTTDYVLLETINGLSHHQYRSTAAAFMAEIKAATEFDVVRASASLMDAGFDLFS